MRKITLSAMIAMLASGGAFAQSSVTVYGLVDLYAGKAQYSGQASNTKLDSGGMQTSHIGFAGKEDLGGGLSASFDLSGFLRADTGQSGRFSGIPGVADDALFSRRAIVSLEGNFGEVRLGRGGTPYFISMMLFNPLGDSFVFSPILLHTYTGGQNPLLAPPLNTPDSGASNMIQYSTPNFDGLRAHFQYSFGEVAGNSGKNRLSASANYMKGPLGLSFAVERDKIPLASATEDKQTSLLAGGYYDFGAAKVFVQHSQTKQEFTTANSDRKFTTTQLGASIPVGAVSKLLLSWGHTNIDLPATGVSAYAPTPAAPIPAGTATSGVSPKRDTVSLVYDYSFSRRTDLYAVLMNDKYTGLGNGTTAVVGLRHRF